MSSQHDPPPHLSRNPSTSSRRSTRSTASDATVTEADRPNLPQHQPTYNPHARRQQGLWVPSGTPLVPGLGSGLAERSQFGGTSYDSLASMGTSDGEGSELGRDGNAHTLGVRRCPASLSPARAEGSTSVSPAGSRHRRSRRRSHGAKDSRSPSRPVGSLRPAPGAGGSPLDALTDLPDLPASPVIGSTGAGTEDRRTGSADDWDNMRDGSIARRPNWRKPSPRWLLPFVIGMTSSIGMTMAPRTELYLDLACLAHPPRMPSGGNNGSTDGTGSASVLASAGVARHLGAGIPAHDFWSTAAFTSDVSGGNKTVEVPAPMPAPSPPPPPPPSKRLSPGEKWFLYAIHDMYTHRRETPTSPGGGGNGTTIPAPGGGAEPPWPEIDPALCKKDDKVQAAAARLTMTLTVVAGILSAITTGHWATVSDRIGRRPIMAMVESGLMLNDLCFLILASFPRIIMQGGIYVLLVGPILDGCLGGFSTMSATMHAYISDVTPDGSRATTFARLGGAVMSGFAVGPILGSALISATGNILAPFYVSVLVHFVFALSQRFILPESLSSDSRAALAKRAAAQRERQRTRHAAEIAWEGEGEGVFSSIANVGAAVWGAVLRVVAPRAWERREEERRLLDEAYGVNTDDDSDYEMNAEAADSSWSRISGAVRRSRTTRRTAGTFRRVARKSTTFLKPLGIFKPRVVNGKRDYNLTMVGLCVFFMSLLMGVIQIKFQYCLYAFGWGTGQLGPYMSFISVCRMIVLLGITPVVMYYLKPFFTERTIVEDATETTPLLASGHTEAGPSSNSRSRSRSHSPNAGKDEKPKPKRSAALDILVLRVALVIEAIGYTVAGLNTHASPAMFIGATAFLTLGSSGSAAASSLALTFIPHAREAGRLFGGLAVLQALGSALISPILFSNVFAWSVGWYAPLVFLLAAVVMTCAQGAVAFVRLPRHEEEERGGRSRGRERGPKRRAVDGDE